MRVSHRREVSHRSPEVLQLLVHHPHLQLNLSPGRGVHRQLQRYLQVLQRADGFLSFSSELQAWLSILIVVDLCTCVCPIQVNLCHNKGVQHQLQ